MILPAINNSIIFMHGISTAIMKIRKESWGSIYRIVKYGNVESFDMV